MRVALNPYKLVAEQHLHESGSADMRMIPIAVVVWLGAFCGQAELNHTLRYIVAISLATVALYLPALLLRACYHQNCSRIVVSRKMCALLIWCRRSAPTVVVMLAACAASTGASVAWSTVQRSDPAYQLAAARNSTNSTIIRVLSPITVSALRSSTCRADVRVMSVQQHHQGAIAMPSRLRARIVGDDEVCEMRRGAEYRIVVQLSISEFDNGVQLEAVSPATRASASIVSEPHILWRVTNLVQQRFLAISSTLSEQGRVLVPGLTLGVLGQEAVAHTGQTFSTLDPAYAEMVKDQFKRSGIMHLMVVSGGHFLLLSSLIHKVLKGLLLHRAVIAGALVFGACMLTAVVYPSDAVWRATTMSVLGALAVLKGRRAQVLSQLSWTVVLLLLSNPHLSTSYGFALSCAAVLGIVTVGSAITSICERVIGSFAAGQLGIAVGAQMFTLPIQLLMDPEIPILSVPTNIVVAPAVNLATIFGLLALSTACFLPKLAYGCAWLSSIGTSLMYDCAKWLSDTEISIMTWLPGWQGVILMLLIELLCIAIVISLHHITTSHRCLRDQAVAHEGIAYRRSVRSSVLFWIRESIEMFEW